MRSADTNDEPSPVFRSHLAEQYIREMLAAVGPVLKGRGGAITFVMNSPHGLVSGGALARARSAAVVDLESSVKLLAVLLQAFNETVAQAAAGYGVPDKEMFDLVFKQLGEHKAALAAAPRSMYSKRNEDVMQRKSPDPTPE